MSYLLWLMTQTNPTREARIGFRGAWFVLRGVLYPTGEVDPAALAHDCLSYKGGGVA